jgi:hypothetical protein
MTKRIGIDRRHVPEQGMMSLNQHFDERSRGRLHSAAADFSPSDINNLLAWYKIDSFTQSHNDAIGTWTDSSGNGYNLSQATTSSKPTYKTDRQLNGHDALWFDGGDDMLNNSISSTSNLNFTLFFATDSNSFNYGFIGSFDNGTNGYANGRKYLGVNPKYYVVGSNSVYTNSHTVYRNEGSSFWNREHRRSKSGVEAYPAVLSYRFSTPSGTKTQCHGKFNGVGGDIAYIQRNEAFVTAFSLGSAMGNYQRYRGHIYECVIYSADLTEAQVEQVEGYLAWKYGLGERIARDHSYAAGKP